MTIDAGNETVSKLENICNRIEAKAYVVENIDVRENFDVVRTGGDIVSSYITVELRLRRYA